MTNALISFLAQLGADASLQDPQAVQQAAREAGLNEQQIAALLHKESTEFAEALQVRTEIVCAMVPAEDEPDESEKPAEEDKDAKNASIQAA